MKVIFGEYFQNGDRRNVSTEYQQKTYNDLTNSDVSLGQCDAHKGWMAELKTRVRFLTVTNSETVRDGRFTKTGSD